jgi:hypothetical protein
MMEREERSLWSPRVAMSRPSSRICPEKGSTNRNNATINDDFPLPVLHIQIQRQTTTA